MRTFYFDVEIYPNYFLASFLRDDGKLFEFEIYKDVTFNPKRLKAFMLDKRFMFISFNGIKFDIPVIGEALKNPKSPGIVNVLRDKIIKENIRPWAYGKWANGINHIDLIEVAPGFASLKLYGGRMASIKLQDLPVHPDKHITDDERAILRKYCVNDLTTTRDLHQRLLKQIDLREQMNKQLNIKNGGFGDLRSKSDAQVAETVFRERLWNEHQISCERPSLPKNYSFKYKAPYFLKFEGNTLNAIFEDVKNSTFTLSDKGQPVAPDALKQIIELNGTKYKLGLGGLHSCEKLQAVVINDDELLYEADVASYYPFIILGQNLYPEHLTESFLHIYRDIVNTRIDAKHSGDKVTADSLKITINGSFGKLGSPYSFLYAPQLLIQTTVTGQIAILMLIEQVNKNGGQVVSANTDGIVIRCKKTDYDAIHSTCHNWEVDCQFTLEETFYKSLHSKDVNNYIAITTKDKVKTKGAYASASLMKNTVNSVCIDAVIAYLQTGADIRTSIYKETDVTKFLTIKTVNGGAIWRGEELGKVVRWYYATDGESIHYITNGNKVGKSDGANPMMNIADSIPSNIDYNWYITDAVKLLENLGVIV